ncbi:hypothetical protein C8A00DRAFT_19527 [Chaetomidium leptoderma]|uniref:Uncharacterized protein n=1 Tax=Chaetomidium leptoderma TaxID=669021 RepID=A0AAN6VDU3_9PEZI|nr:hypothetical protein C8A00DRAFT_19527 [Chaetomidium leptoderma]
MPIRTPFIPELDTIQALKAAGFFVREHRVNALWNTILHRLYDPLPLVWPPSGAATSSRATVISAEIYPQADDTHGQRADLAVSEVVLRPPASGAGSSGSSPTFQQTFKLVYEGKGTSNTSATPDTLKSQMQTFLLASDVGHTTPCWVLGVKGTVVGFFAWNGSASMFRVVPNTSGATRDITSLTVSTRGGQDYDLSDHAQYLTAVAMLALLPDSQPDTPATAPAH